MTVCPRVLSKNFWSQVIPNSLLPLAAPQYALGATVLCLPTNTEGRVDLVALLAALHDRGVGSVLVEGGAGMITALLQARLVAAPPK
jgi:riboflavin biosynthesis pyrimidine reductase